LRLSVELPAEALTRQLAEQAQAILKGR